MLTFTRMPSLLFHREILGLQLMVKIMEIHKHAQMKLLKPNAVAPGAL